MLQRLLISDRCHGQDISYLVEANVTTSSADLNANTSTRQIMLTDLVENRSCDGNCSTTLTMRLSPIDVINYQVTVHARNVIGSSSIPLSSSRQPEAGIYTSE